MLKRLRLLVALQEIDQEILEIKQELARIPEEAARREAALDTKREKLEKLELSAKSLHIDNKELELEIAALDSSVNRSQQKLLEVPDQKSYNALRNQIATNKADQKHKEDLSLELMEKLETVQEQIRKLKEEVATEQEIIEHLRQQSKDQREQARDKVAELKDERRKLVDKIDPEDYHLYRKLMRPPEFVAITELTGQGLCKTCNVQVEPQVLNRLYIGREMVFCSNCGRVLYLHESIESGGPENDL